MQGSGPETKSCSKRHEEKLGDFCKGAREGASALPQHEDKSFPDVKQGTAAVISKIKGDSLGLECEREAGH